MLHRRLLLSAIALCLAGSVAVGHQRILATAGNYLVEEQPPVRADAILVLAGDASGMRILKGAELLRQGHAPVVYVSGPRDFYGHSEDELAIAFIKQRGLPVEQFIGVPNKCNSTRDEASLFVPLFRGKGIRSFILVTSNYHTRRAASVFRKVAAPQGLTFTTVAAKDNEYEPAQWWTTRQGRKLWLYEALKTAAEWAGA